jgi:hypothetical protein
MSEGPLNEHLARHAETVVAFVCASHGAWVRGSPVIVRLNGELRQWCVTCLLAQFAEEGAR